MDAEIINIGDELLIGQVINTNASWMSEQLNLAGFGVSRVTVIPDSEKAIIESLKEAENRTEIILITGGLGPTKDDLTKKVLCEYFNTRLIFHEPTLRDIQSLFDTRGYNVTLLNRTQAEIPEMCTPIPNTFGTAPGMWFEKGKGGKTIVFISMPGVPHEMKAMFTAWVIPHLKEKFISQVIFHKTILTQGVGESFLSDMLEDWETHLPECISLAYLPQPGIVRLRMTARGENREELRKIVDNEEQKLNKIIPQYIFGYDNDSLEDIVGKLLAERGLTVSTAESCTGGYIAHLITRIPGSSRYFKGSVVAYANETKMNILGVKEGDLGRYGAVSEQVVIEMAEGARKKMKTDYVIATSGIAGPDGGTKEKPVGTAWIAIATPGKTLSGHFMMGEERERNIRKTALQALNMLRKAILGIE
ncbi:MAG: competence/damage-inducible protein A [Bacteroidota bacterium]|nr:competence/damage-inducible protein A [Bacteroidota bacterium]